MISRTSRIVFSARARARSPPSLRIASIWAVSPIRRRISAVIGEQLPGHGTVYLGQTLKFRAPVRPGDRVEATVAVTGIDHSKRRVTLDCKCRVGDTVVLEGEALVLAPSRKFD